jgi:hypothetical protein
MGHDDGFDSIFGGLGDFDRFAINALQSQILVSSTAAKSATMATSSTGMGALRTARSNSQPLVSDCPGDTQNFPRPFV